MAKYLQSELLELWKDSKSSIINKGIRSIRAMFSVNRSALLERLGECVSDRLRPSANTAREGLDEEGQLWQKEKERDSSADNPNRSCSLQYWV